jgi:hypothetical protein
MARREQRLLGWKRRESVENDRLEVRRVRAAAFCRPRSSTLADLLLPVAAAMVTLLKEGFAFTL